MITLLSHLSHVEIATPDVEASVVFYEERLGLRVVGRDGGKVYLRSWGDYAHHSVVISEGPEPALVEIGWRTTSPEALEAAARRVEDAGVTGEWSDRPRPSAAPTCSRVRGATRSDSPGTSSSTQPTTSTRRSTPTGPRSARASPAHRASSTT